jgi:hypothetical protein
VEQFGKKLPGGSDFGLFTTIFRRNSSDKIPQLAGNESDCTKMVQTASSH